MYIFITAFNSILVSMCVMVYKIIINLAHSMVFSLY